MTLTAGEVFEQRYRVLRELGAGGFATVYLAEHLQIGQRVAIKILHEAGGDERFLREGKILARLTSRHTVRILDFGETKDGYLFSIFEFVEGEPLADIIERGPMGVEDVLSVIEQILASLAEAHDQGIIHRDIKPANVMRMPNGEVKVLDFGIARLAQSADVEKLTASGVVIGTTRYLAPEVLLNPESVQPAADIYAVGLLAYVLLTGRDANDGLTSRQIVARHLNSEPFELPSEVDVAEPVRRWVRICVHKISTERYADGGVALDALRAARAENDSPPAPRPPERNGLRELELDLGDGEFLDAKLDDVNLPPIVTVAPAATTRVERSSRRWPWLVGLAIVFALMSGAYAVAAGKLKLDTYGGEPSNASAPAPPDPQEIVDHYSAGRAAFDNKQWIEALRHFREVSSAPGSLSAADLERRGLTGRAIANVLEAAIDDREKARSLRQYRAAAEGPEQVLELFPGHEATQEVILSIAEAQPAPRKRKAPRKTAPEVIDLFDD